MPTRSSIGRSIRKSCATRLPWRENGAACCPDCATPSSFCEHCGREKFYDRESLNSPSAAPVCPFCQKTPQLPYRLRLGKSVIVLTHQAKLFPRHLDDHQPFNFANPVAEVVQHPKDPNIWGLKNLTSNKWVITAADGSVKDVEPSKSAPLASGSKISFGRLEGEIRN